MIPEQTCLKPPRKDVVLLWCWSRFRTCQCSAAGPAVQLASLLQGLHANKSSAQTFRLRNIPKICKNEMSCHKIMKEMALERKSTQTELCWNRGDRLTARGLQVLGADGATAGGAAVSLCPPFLLEVLGRLEPALCSSGRAVAPAARGWRSHAGVLAGGGTRLPDTSLVPPRPPLLPCSS